MTQHLYVYGTGERPDGFGFCVAESEPGLTRDLALFVDKAHAHLFAHDVAKWRGWVVHVLPSAEFGTGVGGWPLALVREPYKALRRGETTLMCPECSSFDISIDLRIPPFGTGANGHWRVGDGGATQYAYCHDCHTASDAPR